MRWHRAFIQALQVHVLKSKCTISTQYMVVGSMTNRLMGHSIMIILGS